MANWRRHLGLQGKSRFQLGLCVQPDHIDCVQLKANDRSVLTSASLPTPSLADWVRESKCNQADCVLTLAPNQYQLLQIEKPAVADSELREAVRWKIKDQIEFDPGEAAIDVFHAPPSRQQGRPATVFVAAAQKSELVPMLDQIASAGLNTWKIDITELALRNLSERLAADVTVAVVYLSEPRGLIQIARNETLFLARRMDVSLDRLQPSETSHDAWEALTLDVQRTMDYYDSNTGGAPVKRVLVAPPSQAHPALISTLGVGLGIPVEAFDTAPLMNAPEQAGDGLLAALGGALQTRNEAGS